MPGAVAGPAEDPTVDVTIDSFTPATPKPGQPVTITGRVTNTSNTTFDNAQASVCITEQRLTTRAQLAAIPTEADEPVQKRNSCVGLNNSDSTTFQEFDEPVGPKETVSFRLVVRWTDWKIGTRPGVYTVGVRFRGNTSPNDRVSAGLTRTLMPVIDGKPTPRKVSTAVVLPLRHRPTLLSGDRFANDSLAQSLAPNGALGRLLALGQKAPVTWLVDPAMIDEARQLAKGYRVLGSNHQTKPGTGQKVAQAWLKAFDATRAQNPVVLLPYGDPDVAGLIDAGGPLRELVRKSRSATEQFNLGGSSLFRSGLWLENGSASSRNLAAASTGYAGAKSDDLNLVTSSSWLSTDRPSLSPSPVYDVLTPEGPVKSVRTVVADSTLTAGGPDAAPPGSPVQVRQRFAAETALLASTGTGPITVVATPPRAFDDDDKATAGLMEGLALPWITPVGIDDVTSAATKPQVARPPSTPKSPAGLVGGQLEQVKQLDSATTSFTSMLANPSSLDPSFSRALLRAGSSSWRGFPDEAQRFATFELTAVNSQLGKVHLVSSSASQGRGREIKVNLSGSKGTFPLTIVNGLDVSVRVGIVVTSGNREDLRIKPLQTKVLAAGVKATYPIEASAEQNGLIRADAQVITADQRPVGRSQELLIEAAQYGSVGWILVGSAVALLFGTSLVRIYRRIRSDKRKPSESAETGPDPLHPAPLDLGSPHDPDTPQGAGSTPEPGSAQDPGNPLDPVTPGQVTPEQVKLGPAPANGVPGEGAESLKEGVGTKDG